MDTKNHIKFLQQAYAGMLADAVYQLGREGVLENVVQKKKQEQLATGQIKAKQFGVETPEEVFTKLADLFGCANWQITVETKGFVAETKGCLLCALAKKMNASQPCVLYCLDPMEGMVRGLQPNAQFLVKETLWYGPKCRVEVKRVD
jgi:hypothetical protein